jgi:nucleoside-diphosphate-sugar epimerase
MINMQKMKYIDSILVNKNSNIKDTMRVIDRSGIKIAIVVDESNSLCGTVTDGDIRRGILNGIDIKEVVTKVMNHNPIYLPAKTSPEIILGTIKQKKIIGLPLVDKDKIVKDFILLAGDSDIIHFGSYSKIKKHIQKVLVIGGAGYIGSVLTRKLLSKGYKVTVLDKFLYGKESLKDVESNPNLKIIGGDTRHIEDIMCSITDIDAVIHLAELVGDPACSLNPATTLEINYLATKAIASICKHFQINRLIYASSCSVYGASNKNQLLTEESMLNPVSLYAKMKIASENALLEMKDDNFLPTILRLATVFGFSHRPRFDLVVNLLTAKAIKENKITIFGGKQWRPNVHVEDVADTIIAVLESPIEKVGGQVFNVGSEKNNHTIAEIGKQVKQIVPEAEIIEERGTDERDYKVNFSKLRNVVNIEMQRNVLHGIQEIKKSFEENPGLNYKDKRYSNVQFLKENNERAS